MNKMWTKAKQRIKAVSSSFHLVSSSQEVQSLNLITLNNAVLKASFISSSSRLNDLFFQRNGCAMGGIKQCHIFQKQYV